MSFVQEIRRKPSMASSPFETSSLRRIQCSVDVYAAGAGVSQKQWQDFSYDAVVPLYSGDQTVYKVYPHQFNTNPCLISGLTNDDKSKVYTVLGVTSIPISPRNNSLVNAPLFYESQIYSAVTFKSIRAEIVPYTASTSGGSGTISIEEGPQSSIANTPLTGRVSCAAQWNSIDKVILHYDFPSGYRTLHRSNNNSFDPSSDFGVINLTTSFPSTAIPAGEIIKVATLNITYSISFSEYALSAIAMALPTMSHQSGGGGTVTSSNAFKGGSSVYTQPDYYNPNNCLKPLRGRFRKGDVPLSRDFSLKLGSFRNLVLSSRRPLNHPVLKALQKSKQCLRGVCDPEETLSSFYSVYNGSSMHAFGPMLIPKNVFFSPGYYFDASNYDQINALLQKGQFDKTTFFDKKLSVFSCIPKREKDVINIKNLLAAEDVPSILVPYEHQNSQDPHGIGCFFYNDPDAAKMPIGLNIPLVIPLNASQKDLDSTSIPCSAPLGDALQNNASQIINTTDSATQSFPAQFGGSEDIDTTIPVGDVTINGFSPPATILENSSQDNFLTTVAKIATVIPDIIKNQNGTEVPMLKDPALKVSAKVSTAHNLTKEERIKIVGDPDKKMTSFKVTLDEEMASWPRSHVAEVDRVMRSYERIIDTGIYLEDSVKYSITEPGDVNNDQFIQASISGSSYTVLPLIIGDKNGDVAKNISGNPTYGKILDGDTIVPLSNGQGMKLKDLYDNCEIDSSVSLCVSRFPLTESNGYKHAIIISPLANNMASSRATSVHMSVGNGQDSSSRQLRVRSDEGDESVGGVMTILSGVSKFHEDIRISIPDKLPDEHGSLEEVKEGDTLYFFAVLNSRIIIESANDSQAISSFGSKASLMIFPGFPQDFPNAFFNPSDPNKVPQDSMPAIPLFHTETLSATALLSEVA